MNLLSSADVLDEFRAKFDELYPDFNLQNWVTQPQAADARPDVSFEIKLPTGRTVACVGEAKGRSAPSLLSGAAAQARRIGQLTGMYPVVLAPYVSTRGRAAIREFQVGYMDLAGNCLLNAERAYISIEGKPNRHPEPTRLRSPFKGKSQRVVRLLLENPDRLWTQSEMANGSELSVGYVNRIVTALSEEMWILKLSRGGFKLGRGDALLDEFRQHYSFRRSAYVGIYSLDGIDGVRRALLSSEFKSFGDYALTMYSAADLLAPFTTSQRLDFYFSADPREALTKLGATEVASGETARIYEPYDEFVFYRARMIGGYRVASPLQVYLDLFSLGGRAAEQAEALRTSLLKFDGTDEGG